MTAGLDDVAMLARLVSGGAAAGFSTDEFERLRMKDALERHGSQRAAAAALRMKRSTFNDKARRYGLVATAR